MKKWYRLDNAAKIFPALNPKDETNYFRLEAEFVSDVKIEFLSEAVKTALERFPMFCVRLRHGLFWFYFEHNYEKPLIREENYYLFDTVYTDEHHNFLFTVEYFHNRLSLEVFHSLSDGTGAMEFFKSIIYYYLNFSTDKIKNDGSILTDEIEKSFSEEQDSFNYNYKNKVKKYPKEPKAFHLSGTSYQDNFVGVIHMEMNINKVKEVAKKHDATITEYLGAVLLFSLYKNYQSSKKLPIKLFVPVNGRRFFDSKTLRNFVLFIRTGLDMKNNIKYELKDIIEIIKSDFDRELKKENLERRLVSTVKIEKMFYVRLIPLFIKSLIMKLSYESLGSDLNSMSFSNLGAVKVPDEFNKYLKKMRFMIGASNKTKINTSAVTYNNILTLSFTTKILERNIQRDVARILKNDGIDVTLITNDLEAGL